MIASLAAGRLPVPVALAQSIVPAEQQRQADSQKPNPPVEQEPAPVEKQAQQVEPVSPSRSEQCQPQQPATGGSQKAPATQDQNVGDSSVIIPPQLPKEPPPVAPGYKAPARPLPSAERVGIDQADQTPLTLGQAIALALANNKDINASRIDSEIAGFDLKAARGVYDPRISSEYFYERRKTPTASVIGGGPDGSITQTDATGRKIL